MVHAITWVITLIAENKQVQHQLREDVDANWDKLHEYLSKSDTLLHRSFLETIRLQPPASEYISTCIRTHCNMEEKSLTKSRLMVIVFNIGESSPSVKNFKGILVKPKVNMTRPQSSFAPISVDNAKCENCT